MNALKMDLDIFHENAFNPRECDLASREACLAKALKYYEIQCPDEIIHALCLMPASRKYHGNYEGGLLEHSVNTFIALCSLTDSLRLEWQNPRSPFVVGTFHDLCKTDLYEFTEDGIVYAENAAPGHGEKSVEIAKSFIPDLTEEEELCIRWHMGAFDEQENWPQYNAAIAKYPNVLFTHTADMVASQIFEKE